MRKLIALLCLAAAISLLAGCSSNKQEEAPPKITMPVNNDAPEAKTAGAAPRETDTPTPGEMMKKGRKGGL